MNVQPLLMTGKLTFRVDDNFVTLRSRPDGMGTAPVKTGSRTADLEITIDLDELRARLIDEAMRTKTCSLTRIDRSIVVKPVKGTVRTTGTGDPW